LKDHPVKVATAAFLFASLPLTGAHSAEVSVVVEGLRNTNGNIAVCLWLDRIGFPDCSKSTSARQRIVAATEASRPLTFRDLPGNTFAVTLIHDENANGKFDTYLIGIPKEGAGASNDAISRFAPPRYDPSSFTVQDKAVQRIRLVYWGRSG
jgi:uncharacterized protein (DUF2141 family)